MQFYRTLTRVTFILAVILTVVHSSAARAQNLDSLLAAMDSSKAPERVFATFKSPTIVFSQSNETRKAHTLGLVFRHDFGPIGGPFGGSHTLFGLDVVQDVYIGVDYGISDRLSIGLGRGTYNETYNFDAKYRLLQQTEGRGVPFSLTLFAQPALITRRPFESLEFTPFSKRSSLFLQAIIARKFSSSFSVEVTPAFLHQSKTFEFDTDDSRNLATLGLAGRMKLTKRFALLVDYQLVNGLTRSSGKLSSHTYYNPLGVGFEMETGGHVFSLLFQNTNAILENNFLANTTRSWRHSGVSFAFGISRDFTLKKRHN